VNALLSTYFPEKKQLHWTDLRKHPAILQIETSRERIYDLRIDNATVKHYATKYLLAKLNVMEKHIGVLLKDESLQKRTTIELGQIFANTTQRIIAEYRREILSQGVPQWFIALYAEYHSPRERKLVDNLVWYSTGGVYSSAADYAWDALTMLSQANMVTIGDMEVVANKLLSFQIALRTYQETITKNSPSPEEIDTKTKELKSLFRNDEVMITAMEQLNQTEP
jgi:hypothetical protein